MRVCGSTPVPAWWQCVEVDASKHKAMLGEGRGPAAQLVTSRINDSVDALLVVGITTGNVMPQRCLGQGQL